MKHVLLLCFFFALASCGDSAVPQQTPTAVQAQRWQDAQARAKNFKAAVAAQDWVAACVYGTDLLNQYPDMSAAKQVQGQIEDVCQHARVAREQRRLAALWAYSQVPVDRGTQRSAMIEAREQLDLDGHGPKRVQLVFRDHPVWKRSAYLILGGGDFARGCYRHCYVQVRVDGGVARAMAATRPDTQQAIAMFIDDDPALWKLAARAKRVISITFPVQAGGSRVAVFESGGLDKAQMPGWE